MIYIYAGLLAALLALIGMAALVRILGVGPVAGLV